QEICRVDELKRIKAHVRPQDLDRPCGLARIHQDLSVSIVDVIGVEREGSLEFGVGGVVLALVKQDMPKLSAGLWQAGVEVHRYRRKFKGAVYRSRTEMIAIERVGISNDMSPGHHRSGVGSIARHCSSRRRVS